jgi:hypothetical protein
VNRQPSRRSLLRGHGRLSVVIAGTLVISLGAAASARADTVDQANAQARQLAAAIDKLQPQVDADLAAYDTSLASVAQAVSANIAAGQIYNALKREADSLVAQENGHIVALYEAGGSLALYATVLQSGQPADLHQLPYLKGIVNADAASAANAVRVAEAAKASVDSTQAAIDSGLANADLVNRRLAAVQDVIGQQQALLDQASDRAKNLQALKDAAAALAASRQAAAQAGAQAAESVTPYPIPPLYRSLYQAAAQTCPGLSWTVLAAIGQVETHHGSGTMVSSAGALGPMQFLIPTFVHYARDGDRDGKADIMNPADSIYTAAGYLCANGAGAGGDALYTALWNYNHADWYVQLVLALSSKLG